MSWEQDNYVKGTGYYDIERGNYVEGTGYYVMGMR